MNIRFHLVYHLDHESVYVIFYNENMTFFSHANGLSNCFWENWSRVNDIPECRYYNIFNVWLMAYTPSTIMFFCIFMDQAGFTFDLRTFIRTMFHIQLFNDPKLSLLFFLFFLDFLNDIVRLVSR
jgi:hypothetical protein